MYFGWCRQIPSGKWSHFSSSDNPERCWREAWVWAERIYGEDAYSIVILPDDEPPVNLKRRRKK